MRNKSLSQLTRELEVPASSHHNQFYRVAFRKKLYTSIAEIQADADEWTKRYNEERTHTGKYCFGRTPPETFIESKHLATEKQLERLLGTSVSYVDGSVAVSSTTTAGANHV